MKNFNKLIVPLVMLLAAFLLIACDVAFDGPQYHFKLVNRTRGIITGVTINGAPCGTMYAGKSCTVYGDEAPSLITVNYQSAVLNGSQETFEQTFTPNASVTFDEQNLYLDNDYFSLVFVNKTTDNPGESIDYLIVGFAVSSDGSDFTEEYDINPDIDNDEEVYFLGFFDRLDPDVVGDTGIMQVRALVENGGVPEDPADWTATDLLDNIEELSNTDGGGYYSEVIFHGPDTWSYDASL